MPGVELLKVGTKEQFLGKAADYTITVSNTGDTKLTNLVITDTAPAATRIVTAAGATVAGNVAPPGACRNWPPERRNPSRSR